MNKNQLLNSVPGACLTFILVKVASFFKVSFIVGSSMAFFSGSAIAVPLVGALGGMLMSGIVFGIGFPISLFTSGLYSLHLLAYHIPGFCAAAYWGSNSRVIRLFLPIVCMVAFIAHPQGAAAFPYALYWLIPVALYFKRHNSLFLTALGSTLIAHAVGSVIWIYTVPMDSSAWLALIPVVAVERLAFAVGMVLCYNAIAYGKNVVAAVGQLDSSKAVRNN